MSGNQEGLVRPMQIELSALGMDDEDWLKDSPQLVIPSADKGVAGLLDEPERVVKAGQALCRALDRLLSYAQDARDAANLLVQSFAALPDEEGTEEDGKEASEVQTKDGESDASVS